MPAYLIRWPEDLHRLVRVAAASQGVSVNAWLVAIIRHAVIQQARGDEAVEAALKKVIDRPAPGK